MDVGKLLLTFKNKTLDDNEKDLEFYEIEDGSRINMAENETKKAIAAALKKKLAQLEADLGPIKQEAERLQSVVDAAEAEFKKAEDDYKAELRLAEEDLLDN